MKNFEDSVKKLTFNFRCYNIKIAQTFVVHLENWNRQKDSEIFIGIHQEREMVRVTCANIIDMVLLYPLYRFSTSEACDAPFEECEQSQYFKEITIKTMIEFTNALYPLHFWSMVMELISNTGDLCGFKNPSVNGCKAMVTCCDWDSFYNSLDKIIMSV